MRFSSLKTTVFRFGFGAAMQDVMQDASDLLRRHGDRAHEVAQQRSAQEDIGLALTRRPDHWNRVARAIATPRGRTAAECRFDFATSAADHR